MIPFYLFPWRQNCRPQNIISWLGWQLNLQLHRFIFSCTWCGRHPLFCSCIVGIRCDALYISTVVITRLHEVSALRISLSPMKRGEPVKNYFCNKQDYCSLHAYSHCKFFGSFPSRFRFRIPMLFSVLFWWYMYSVGPPMYPVVVDLLTFKVINTVE